MILTLRRAEQGKGDLVVEFFERDFELHVQFERLRRLRTIDDVAHHARTFVELHHGDGVRRREARYRTVMDDVAVEFCLAAGFEHVDLARGAGRAERSRREIDIGAGIAALQALEKLDPEWVRDYLPKSGIDKEDLTLAPLEIPVTSKFMRHRRHTRVRLRKSVRAVCTNLKESCSMEIKTASLTGGVATLSRHLTPGTQVQLRLQIGMRNLQATALMRDSRAQDMAFEIVDMNLDERSKYRRMLAGNLSYGSSSPAPAESDSTSAPVETLASR